MRAAMPRVAVIGAGVLGAATAHALAQAGFEVEVLEAAGIAGGASAATFAMDISRLKTPRAFFDLSLQSRHDHAALEKLAKGPRWVHPARSLEWARSPEAQRDIERQIRRLRSWGYPVEVLTADSAHQIEPALAPSALEGQPIALYPHGCWYEPRVFARTLLELARRWRATVHTHDRVIELVRSGARITTIKTARGRRISADVVVNCAGPGAAHVAALAETELPLRQVPGLVTITTPAGDPLRSIVAADDLHARPHHGDRILLHSWRLDGELDGGPPWTNADSLARDLLDQARRLLPGLADSSVQAAAVGVRPIPLDGLPIVGFVPGCDNLYAVVAHSAVHLAPILARLAAQDLTGADADQLEPFRPTRLRQPARESELLDESARMMLAQITHTD